MSITPAQLCKLLDALPEPARICDGNGMPVAENQAAQGLDWKALNNEQGRVPRGGAAHPSVPEYSGNMIWATVGS